MPRAPITGVGIVALGTADGTGTGSDTTGAAGTGALSAGQARVGGVANPGMDADGGSGACCAATMGAFGGTDADASAAAAPVSTTADARRGIPARRVGRMRTRYSLGAFCTSESSASSIDGWRDFFRDFFDGEDVWPVACSRSSRISSSSRRR